MATPSSPETPITGKDWTKEVGSITYEKEKVRADFYKKRAEFKLQTPNIEDVLKDPAKAGFKTLKELEDGPAFAEVKVKAGDSLFKILDAYFKSQGVGDKSQKETYLSLHHLNTQQEVSKKNINVDYLLVGETVKIEKGRLTIVGANGTERIKDALLRPAAAIVAPPAAPAPVAPPVDATPPIPRPDAPAPAPGPAPAPDPAPLVPPAGVDVPPPPTGPAPAPVPPANPERGVDVAPPPGPPPAPPVPGASAPA